MTIVKATSPKQFGSTELLPLVVEDVEVVVTLEVDDDEELQLAASSENNITHIPISARTQQHKKVPSRHYRHEVDNVVRERTIY